MSVEYPCEICSRTHCNVIKDGRKGKICPVFKLKTPDWGIHFNNDPSQSAKADNGKLKLTLVPHQIIRDIARVRMYGNQKYPDGGPDNWKRVSPQRYRDALYRHLLLYLEDPHGVDEESGIPHIAHIACNVAFLCEFEKEEELWQTLE